MISIGKGTNCFFQLLLCCHTQHSKQSQVRDRRDSKSFLQCAGRTKNNCLGCFNANRFTRTRIPTCPRFTFAQHQATKLGISKPALLLHCLFHRLKHSFHNLLTVFLSNFCFCYCKRNQLAFLLNLLNCMRPLAGNFLQFSDVPRLQLGHLGNRSHRHALV